MRALCFPWGYGGAAGYTARCIAVAEQLRDAGWEVAFAECGVNRMVLEAGFELLKQETAEARDLVHRKVPPYLPFGNVERVFAVAARYYLPDRVRTQVVADLASIESFRPDLVVIDMTVTAAMAARIADVPTLALADADFLSRADNSWMPWLTIAADRLLPYPPCLPALNRVLVEHGQPAVAHPSDLLWGDLALIPSVPELEPPEPHWEPGRYRHVGPVFWDPPQPDVEFPCSRSKRVYVSVGSGGMVGVDAMQGIVDGLADPEWDVFVSTGFAFDGALSVPANVRVGGFTGIARAIKWADVVVSHGGYSTVIATLLHGKPSVVVPFMSEQEMNGRSLVEAHGAGVLVRKSIVDAESARISYVCRTTGSTTHASVFPVDVADAVASVLADPSYQARARGLGDRLAAARAGARIPEVAHQVARRAIARAD